VLFAVWQSRLVPARLNTSAGDQFLRHLQAHRYAQAHAMLSPSAQRRWNVATLKHRWQVLEAAIGSVRNWRVRSCWIKVHLGYLSYDLTYEVEGQRDRGWVEQRLVRRGSKWEIGEVRFGW